MKHPSLIRHVALLAVLGAIVQHSGAAHASRSDDAALRDGTRPAIGESMPDADRVEAPRVSTPRVWTPRGSSDVLNGAATGAQGNVAELTRLIQQAQLSELRTTYNGSYVRVCCSIRSG